MSEGLGTPPSQSTSLARIPFTAAQEARIRSLSRWLTVLGWIYIGLVVLQVLGMLGTRNGGSIFGAVVQLFIGVWAIRAGEAFRKVADTDVADQDNLLLGFRKLRNIFLLQAILVMVSLALVFSFLFIAIVLAVARPH
jgi:hypothetical protein